MPKMHYFSIKFSKIAKPLNLSFWWPELRDLTKLWFFKLIMTKLNF